MIREVAQLSRLLVDPVFHGTGVPRGDGRPVVVIPGLFGGDLYLAPLRAWLRRIGYTPVRSTLALNAGCPMRLRDQVQAHIANWQQLKAGPFALVGHSRGGVIAWSIAVQIGERVSALAVLGSPLDVYRESAESGQQAHPRTQMGRLLGHASNFARHILDPNCNYPACDCSFMRDTRHALSPKTAFISIVSRDDEVVPLEASRTPAEQTVEVSGRHMALVYNPEVYRALGHFLAASPA
jgi:triacylglycerol lipase